ncbi:MAG: hypothetical protein J6T51_07710 [Kiritimatiellae bacterium]|nr:hypothetical protein [Kiritimatiellia bacterium]
MRKETIVRVLAISLSGLAVTAAAATGALAWFPVDTTDGTLTLKPNSAKRGEVSGGGKYAAGKAVKIKATATAAFEK